MNRHISEHEQDAAAPNSSGLPRNPQIRYHFRVPTFDFFFQWVLGAQTHGGSEIGESFYAASRIKDGDPESWGRAWRALAQRVEARARVSAEHEHWVSARESYLRAYTYYRIPLIFMDPRRDPRYEGLYRKAQSCFRKAIARLDPPGEVIAIPFEGQTLPGYFFKAERDDATHLPRKTLIMIGGADTFVEDLYAYIGPAARKRGYHLLIVDLPGQGILPAQGLVWRAEAEAPMQAVVNYALARPDVDPAGLAAYGISGGGYLVPRAAAHEKRLKAIVACSVILNFGGIWPSNTRDIEKSLRYKLMTTVFRRRLRARLLLMESYIWRWGAHSMGELYERCTHMTVDPSLITCPLLNLVAEQEYTQFGPSRAWATECLAKVAHPNKRVVVTPADEGADSHAAGTNLSLVSQIVFDWLDEIFVPAAGANGHPAEIPRSEVEHERIRR